MSDVLTLETLKSAVVGVAAAFRSVGELEPAGGSGDKVFPSTYEKGVYALETRIVDGQRVPCVLLDSVASQANRLELALLRAHRRGGVKLPLIEVDFSGPFPDLGTITQFEAPHRISDAILRDSKDSSGKAFRDTEAGLAFTRASLKDATGLFEWCPTALLLGMWDSTGKTGGLGVKFARALVSEIVGIDVEQGVKVSSRIDPLQIQKNSGVLYQTEEGWSLAKTKVKLGKDGRPSEANHGNIPPTIEASGGVTLTRIRQYVTLSLPGLRRLEFPRQGANAETNQKRGEAGRTVLAALALYGTALAKAEGLDLRSRCLLVESKAPEWELLGAAGTPPQRFTLDAKAAYGLLESALAEAAKHGLAWKTETLKLTPNPDVVTLVQKSRELASSGSSEAE